MNTSLDHNAVVSIHVDARRIVHLAAVFNNSARARILLLLLEQATMPVTELARLAGTSVTLASHHLATLRVEGWILGTRQGRQRWVTLSSPQRALAVSNLRDIALLARSIPSPASS